MYKATVKPRSLLEAALQGYIDHEAGFSLLVLTVARRFQGDAGETILYLLLCFVAAKDIIPCKPNYVLQQRRHLSRLTMACPPLFPYFDWHSLFAEKGAEGFLPSCGIIFGIPIQKPEGKLYAMAHIAPFAAIHYDPARVSLDRVIAPPYDVLSPAQQDELYARDPWNIVYLMLGKITPEDTNADNRYTRANAFLQDALHQGVMVRDDAPAVYEYIQSFEHPLDPTRFLKRSTLFVALKLEPYANGVVLPHEETHPKAKADRLELMRATQSNPEPIYGLYADAEQFVAQRLEQARGDHAPLLSASVAGQLGPDKEQHLLYRFTDADLIGELQAFLAPLRVWIADGHHRYETALNYRGERGKGKGENEQDESLRPYDYILIGLSAFEDAGMVVLPTHRLVKNIAPERMEELPLLLERYFHVHTLPIPQARAWMAQQTPDEKRFAVVLGDRAYTLTLRDMAQAQAAMEQNGQAHGGAWRRLDVTLLQTLVLDRCLGIGWQALAHTPDVAYTRDEEEAMQKVRDGEFQIACLLQNPTVTEVRDVASEGDKMPQKSTFFYPKLYSGLVMRSLQS